MSSPFGPNAAAAAADDRSHSAQRFLEHFSSFNMSFQGRSRQCTQAPANAQSYQTSALASCKARQPAKSAGVPCNAVDHRSLCAWEKIASRPENRDGSDEKSGLNFDLPGAESSHRHAVFKSTAQSEGTMLLKS
jgi:hypothetical protein